MTWKKVLREDLDKHELDALKRSIAKSKRAHEVESNADILASLDKEDRKKFGRVLRKRDTRSASGVCVVAIMARPFECPGRCAYCPRGENAPQSYTGKEPAARRAIQNEFNAFRQVGSRLRQLEAISHEPSKCELIVMGGTFNAQPRAYQRAFVKKAFDAFNNGKSRTLEGALKKNERARHRVTGLTIETRPDWCSKKQVEEMLALGATRVEIGVQSLDEAVLKKVGRGHGVEEVVKATRNCKEAFLKVCYHVMPGLFAGKREDKRMFKKLFGDTRFRPDMLKVYPALVMPGTKLHKWWRKGEFEPYDAEKAAEVIAECKRFVPRYCRIMRVDRDIPVNLVAAGVKKSNLRQLVHQAAKKKGINCQCIRCREVGLKKPERDRSKPRLQRLDYKASGGDEVFLSLETGAALYAFLRLRRNAYGATGVRELRVYGEQTPVGRKPVAVQHKGFGKKLLGEAEKIATEEFDAKKLLVLSGVGAKPYYRKQGFKQSGFYMVKGI